MFSAMGKSNILFLRVYEGQSSISGSNMIFQQIEVGTSVIPLSRVILTGKSFSYIIFMNDSRSPPRSKGQFQGKINKNMILTNKA